MGWNMLTEPGVIYQVTLREPKRNYWTIHRGQVKYYDFGRWQVRREGSRNWYLVDPAAIGKWGLCDWPHHRMRAFTRRSGQRRRPQSPTVSICGSCERR